MTTTTKKHANKAAALLDEAAETARLAAEAAQIAAQHETNVSAIALDIGKLGELSANGSAALTDAAILFSTAVAAGLANEEDAARLYLAFTAGHNSARRHGIDFMPSTEKTAKVPISLFRTFGKAPTAAVVEGSVGLYERVARVHGTLDRKETTSGYNAYVSVNRAIFDWCVGNPTGTDAKGAPVVDIATNVTAMVAMFSPPRNAKGEADVEAEKAADEWVRARILKDAKGEKSDLEKIAATLETLEKLIGKVPSDKLRDAHAGMVQALADYIADIAAKGDALKTFEVLRAEKPDLRLVEKQAA